MGMIAAVEEECSTAGAARGSAAPAANSVDPERVISHAAPYGWMLFGAAAFAVMGALAHAAGDRIDWRIIALVRAALAFVFSCVLARAAGAKLVVFGPKTLWVRDIAGSLSLICTFYAFTRLPIADTLALTNMFPLWVAVLSWPLLGQIPAAGVWIAACAGITGVLLIQQPHLNKDSTWAVFVAFSASLTSAVAMIGLHRLKDVDPRAIVAHFSGVAVVAMLMTLFLPGTPPVHWQSLSAGNVLELFGVGVMATAGQIAITRAFAAGPPSRISVVALTQVVFGAGLDMLIWERAFGFETVLGMFLILAPTAWVLLRRPEGG